MNIQFRFQIPNNVPNKLTEVGEKCYFLDGWGTGFYKASFISGLRFSLNCLTRKLLRRLGIAISQLTPNTWCTFIGAQVLQGIMSDDQKSLTLDKFLFCYQPLPTLSTKGTYYIEGVFGWGENREDGK